MNSDTLKKRLRYQGKQYDSGQKARGGNSNEPHMLTQAANRIQELESVLLTVTHELESWNLTEGDPVAVAAIQFVRAALAR